jgi:signal transduction histidine kinase/DNA-binding response OmpR family regulator
MRETLAASGRVGEDLLAVDWSTTPIGGPDEWPLSLCTAVRTMLSSKFSMWMAWGPELTFFCNDAYRRATLAAKYPWALGRSAREVWAEIWPDIGPRIQHVIATGESTWDEGLLLFLERSGFKEETYHTFSYSPLTNDAGVVSGMLCVVAEVTEELVNQRRMSTLRDLGIRVSTAESVADAVRAGCDHLADNNASLPWVGVYLFDETGSATLAGTAGIAPGHRAAPLRLGRDDPSAVWPAARLFAGEEVVLDGIDETIPDLPTGAWDLPPQQAVLVPIPKPLSDSPYGFLVFGANRHRPVDTSFFEFVELIAAHFSAAITDARAMEQERERSEALTRLDQAKSDFLANVSHELRTPLTLLLGPAEDALSDRDEPLGPDQRRRLELIARNGARMLRLVNTLLDYSRLEAGRQESSFEPTDVLAYTAELAALFESAVTRAGLTLQVEGESVDVYLDRSHWAKVALNLLSNALKFTFEGSVTVRVRTEGEHALVEVADTGTGIPEDELDHLFERFHRVRGAMSRSFEGSGIGLALVAQLVRLHGGEVSVSSRLGEGSTFTVRLPLGSDHLPLDQIRTGDPGPHLGSVASPALISEVLSWVEEEMPEAEAESAAQTGERPTVLVVDDNADMRHYVHDLLAGTYRVITAEDGLEALERLTEHPVDLVISDVMMPRLDGFGLLGRMREDPLLAAIPVVMLSARAGEEGTLEGLEAGADDYLAKPFSARELMARVHVNLELERVQAVRDGLQRSRDLLDQAQRTARLGSWEIDLDRDLVTASRTFLELFEMTAEEVEATDLRGLLRRFLQRDDVEEPMRLLSAARVGEPLAYETTVPLPDGTQRVLTVRGEVAARGDSERVLRGSVQDVTQQRELHQQQIAAASAQRAAERERAIADELQHSLLPVVDPHASSVEVATFYHPGEAGTQVGGDWYDVVDLGGGRTSFVIGDVMGRGIRAASVMGQMKAAARAFLRLGLTPAEIAENLDSMVQDLAPGVIVTFVHGVYDATTGVLSYINAGNLPPLVVGPDGAVQRLPVDCPPLGAGLYGQETQHLPLAAGSLLVLYTDGLVETRTADLDQRLERLEEVLAEERHRPVAEVPQALVDAMIEDPYDDVALAVLQVHEAHLEMVRLTLGAEVTEIGRVRHDVTVQLRAWDLPALMVADLELVASELITNAVVHGGPPSEVRLYRSPEEIVIEVHDSSSARPRRRRPRDDRAGGRGLGIVQRLTDRWGVKPLSRGKAVWASRRIPGTA